MSPSRETDWERIEIEYRAAQYTIREIGRRHGVSDTAVRKRAKKHGWERDLAAEYRKGVRNRTVRDAANQKGASPLTEKELVDAAAEVGSEAVKGHLARSKRLEGRVDKILDYIGDWLTGDDESRSKLAPVLFAAKGDSLSGMLRAAGDLAERIQRLQRQALGLDESDDKVANDLVPLEERIQTYTQEDEATGGNVVALRGGGAGQ